jgi:probable F420-dependent oxidoreductase
MTPTGLGITIPFDIPLADHAPLFHRLVNAGYAGLWTAETARLDAFTPLAFAAAITPDVVVGTAIASVFSRGPALLAMSAAALADAAPGRSILGIGASSAVMTEDWNDSRFHRPLARVRDTARFLRDALAGERVDREYETFAVHRFRLEQAPSSPVLILVAALREAMLRVGADEADGVVLNWLAPHDVRTVRQVVGAEPTVAARIFVCVGDDDALIRESARRLVATYATVPAYADFHRWLGRGEQLAETWRLWAAGDRRGAIAAVPDEVVDDLIVHGSAERCAELVAQYCAAGVDRPIVKLLALDRSRDLVADAVALATSYPTLRLPIDG